MKTENKKIYTTSFLIGLFAQIVLLILMFAFSPFSDSTNLTVAIILTILIILSILVFLAVFLWNWMIDKKEITAKDEWKQYDKPLIEEIRAKEELGQYLKPVTDYKKILYADKNFSTNKNFTSSSIEQKNWRDLDSTEKKIDKLYITQTKKSITDIDKTVDELIQNRFKKY